MDSFLLLPAYLTNTNFQKQRVKAVRDLPTNRREVVLLSFPSLLFNEHIYCPCNDLLKFVIESLLTCDISIWGLLVLILIPSLYQVMSGAGLEWKIFMHFIIAALEKTRSCPRIFVAMNIHSVKLASVRRCFPVNVIKNLRLKVH